MDNLKLTLQELRIMSVLETGEKYGYQIVKDLENSILLGSLYNALKKMEEKNFVESYWGSEDEEIGARRRYYKITAHGSTVFRETVFELVSKSNLSTPNMI